ncbi:MAG: ATP-binding cassette domain-containing protein [Acidobacteria bacterium]|nr:ATP-binding cassette domain-containing protein [Acidobacteriota bacterium]
MLRIVDLELPLSEFPLRAHLDLESRVTAVVGPSGAGKTSLLETIAGFRTPRRGRIELDGETLLDVAAGRNLPARLRRIGYVPQDDTLFPHLTVRRNLAYAWAAGRDSPTGEFDRVVAVLELDAVLERGISNLSGGERRRVALGRALLARPRLLLCDEPLGFSSTRGGRKALRVPDQRPVSVTRAAAAFFIGISTRSPPTSSPRSDPRCGWWPTRRTSPEPAESSRRIS